MNSLEQFALAVLDLLSKEQEWNADTTDRIARSAIERGLATNDGNGFFKACPPESVDPESIEVISLLRLLHSNAAESPEWIRARIEPVLSLLREQAMENDTDQRLADIEQALRDHDTAIDAHSAFARQIDDLTARVAALENEH